MREEVEKYQAVVYLVAIAVGLGVGTAVPEGTSLLELLIWPTLGLMLYTVFTQVPISGMREAARDVRFFSAAVIGNFVVLPMVVWALVKLAPDEPAVQVGLFMVLLVPCTDWFISFTQLGGGDTRRAILFAPVSLFLQMLLLPAYLWVFLGGEVLVDLARQEMLLAFLGLIVVPLVLAVLTQSWQRKTGRKLEWMAWLPVPLLAAVIFLIAASQVDMIWGTMSVGLLLNLVLVFAAFLGIAGLISRGFAGAFRLGTKQGRVLAFSFGTRNSFVVLPLALALPLGWELAAVVVVLQSVVELFGMVVYLWWVPDVLFPDAR